MKPGNILDGVALVGADQGHAGAQSQGQVWQVSHLHQLRRMVKIKDDGEESEVKCALIFILLTFSFPIVSTRASCLTWPALLCALHDYIYCVFACISISQPLLANLI